MNIFTRIIAHFKQLASTEAAYFREYPEDIGEKNKDILKKLSVIYFCILAAYFIFASIGMKSLILTFTYVIFISLQIAFTVYIYKLFRKNDLAFSQTQRVCIIFYGLVMAFIITISIFPFPDRPAIYFPVSLIGIAILFIFPFRQLMIILVTCGGIFLSLSWLFKTAAIVPYDFYATLSAFIVAIISADVIRDLRMKEYIARSELKMLSSTDKLTGLSNKATAESLCRSYLENQPQNMGSALFVIDIDDFKQVNDTLGHQQGDEVLRRVGAELNTLFRSQDITGRIGGDEFMALMKNCTSPQIVENKAKKIIDHISNLFSNLSADIVSCSIGIAFCEKGNCDYDNYFSKADKALYYSKKHGKNQYTLYSEGYIEEATSKPLMLIAEDTDISRAILVSAFDTDYRIIEAKDGEEALIKIEQYAKTLSVVLLDIIMPHLNGYEVLQEMAKDVRLKEIPVIAMSVEAKTEEKALSLGAVDMVTKPFDIKVIRLRVERARRNL